MEQYTSTIWEELCRRSVPFIIKDDEFNPASRWWGKGIDGVPLEIDVVSESTGKKSLLVGEAKWTENKDVTRVADELIRKSANLPIVYKHKILLVLFVKHRPAVTPPGILIFGPEEVIEGLR
jgi:hypothetical protein